MNDYLIRFTTTLNPNNGTDVVWPQYAPASLQLYTFPTLGLPNVTIDNYRANGLSVLAELGLKYIPSDLTLPSRSCASHQRLVCIRECKTK
jgi:acetylcholinesterase